MSYQIFADGKRIRSREDAVDIKGEPMGDAYDRLTKLLNKGQIDGFSGKIRVRPPQSERWGEPYEGFGRKKGSVKYVVTDADILAKDWVRIQSKAHNAPSVEDAVGGASEKTVDSVKSAINENNVGKLKDIPTPIMEIYMDGTCDYAEGRSRGVGVLQSKREYMPIRIASRVYR